MPHVLLRVKHIIVDHLDDFCVVKHNVLLLHHRLHEVLMDQFPEASPRVSVLHDEQMVATRDEIMGDEWRRSVAVDVGLFVTKFLNEASICEHDCGSASQLERIIPPYCSAHSVNLD